MWNDFKLTISSPATVTRVGKMTIVLALASKLEENICFSDATYLAMSANCNTDSSDMRLHNFFFPVHLTFRRLEGETEKKAISSVRASFWQREGDSRCLVMFNSSNAAENNFEGSFEDALDWLTKKIEANL